MTASHENQEYISTLFDITQTLLHNVRIKYSHVSNKTNGKITADNALCVSQNKINVIIMTEVT